MQQDIALAGRRILVVEDELRIPTIAAIDSD